VRVSQSLCPLTSILSPGGARRYIRGYLLSNTAGGEEKSISKQEFPITEKEHELRRSNGHTRTKNQSK
jgi:hypothetical protein